MGGIDSTSVYKAPIKNIQVSGKNIVKTNKTETKKNEGTSDQIATVQTSDGKTMNIGVGWLRGSINIGGKVSIRQGYTRGTIDDAFLNKLLTITKFEDIPKVRDVIIVEKVGEKYGTTVTVQSPDGKTTTLGAGWLGGPIKMGGMVRVKNVGDARGIIDGAFLNKPLKIIGID